MTKKCLYLTQQQIIKNDGASEKTIAQNIAINKIGIESHLAHIATSGGEFQLYVDDKVFVSVKKYKYLYDSIIEYIKGNQIQLLYLRYTVNASLFFNLFLHNVAKLGVLIYMEIPTYPYDGEMKCTSVRQTVKKYLEQIYRKQWKRSVYKIVTSSTANVIFGIPTVIFSNAPSHNLPVKAPIRVEGRMNMIAVANLAFWHGYDRLLRGLAQYYNNNPEIKVYFTVVGVGNPKIYNDLRELTNELQLNDYVNFIGSKNNEELNPYFEEAHLAVGCLGCHRKNIVEVKALKNVEYAMRGIPMVYSENNTDFDGRPYVYKVPADDTDIDVMSLCDFVTNLQMTPTEIHESVKDFTWDVQMKKVFGCYCDN